MGWVVSVTPRPRFYSWERTPGTQWIGGWVGLRPGLDTEARGKILCLCRGSNPGRPFCSQTIYWLSYPSSCPLARVSSKLINGFPWDFVLDVEQTYFVLYPSNISPTSHKAQIDICRRFLKLTHHKTTGTWLEMCIMNTYFQLVLVVELWFMQHSFVQNFFLEFSWTVHDRHKDNVQILPKFSVSKCKKIRIVCAFMNKNKKFVFVTTAQWLLDRSVSTQYKSCYHLSCGHGRVVSFIH
jgi:hypothetical protein